MQASGIELLRSLLDEVQAQLGKFSTMSGESAKHEKALENVQFMLEDHLWCAAHA